MIDAVDDKALNIDSIINPIKEKASDISNRETVSSIKSAVANLSHICGNHYIFSKAGKDASILFTKSIPNQLGSSVVLDATSKINQIYNVTSWFQNESIREILTENPRHYSNFTINKAIGYPQGKSAIYQNLNEEELKDRAKDYLNLAYSLIGKDDKLLIVSHKDFSIALKAHFNPSYNIEFTNWGNHIGKNEWSDCNKVMIIGWHYLRNQEHYINYANAVGSMESAKVSNAYQDNAHIVSQLADDLVQAISRCSVRKTISEDGNCSISEAYIFYPDKANEIEVMELVESQFVGAKIVQWNPAIDESKIRKRVPKSKTNIQSVLDCIAHLCKDHTDINQQRIVEATGLTKTVVSRTFNDENFLKALDEKGYNIIIRGKSKIVVLK